MQDTINKAVNILRSGGLVALPTETVYGLGADATNPEALKKIFLAKQRPMDHPLIVHIAKVAQLAEWAIDLSPQALQLAAAFWPGPLTLILNKAPQVSDWVTGQQDTVGIRIPRHPVAQALLQAFGGGVAAPSANRFGRISPTTAYAVEEELGDAVDLVLDGGQCEVGLESTIIDVSSGQPIILRPGMISAQQIEAVLQEPIALTKPAAPRVSGSLASHYAPQTPTQLIKLEDLPTMLAASSAAVAVLGYSQPPTIQQANMYWINMPQDPQAYAHELYQILRLADKQGFNKLLIETVPETKAWDAIRDRLQRASQK